MFPFFRGTEQDISNFHAWGVHYLFIGVKCLMRMDHVSLMNLIFPISSVMWSGTW